jgi:hypothetical protein
MENKEQVIRDRRDIWIFRYKPAELLAAANKKVTHHVQRGEWWTAEHTKAEEQLREKGFEYRERQTSLQSEIQIVGDPELAQRVAHCRRKIADHREEQRIFETWARALKTKTERQPGEELELTIQDLVFFGL